MTSIDRLPLPPGTALDGLAVDAVIGVGGYGLIYRAEGQPLAIKEFFPLGLARRAGDGRSIEASDPDRAEAFQKALGRFREEARTLMALSHPAIVPVERLFEANGTAYMVMPLVEGESLSAILEREAPLEEKRLLALARPLLQGLAEVHRHGFLHRDIKPGNIRVRADGSPVLLDFGSAGPTDRRVARPREISPGYAAPEQYDAEADLGPGTDLYAIAAVLYHAVVGRPPRPADDRRPDDDIDRAVDAGLLRYSRAVLQSIDSALALDHRARPASADEFLGMLEGRIAPFGAAAGSQRPRRGRRIAVASGVAAILLAGILVVAFDGPVGTPVIGNGEPDVVRAERRTPGTRFSDCDDCPVMVVLPPGDVSLRADDTALPVAVTVTRAFAIGVFEVTRDQFAAFLADSGREVQAGCGIALRDGVWRMDLKASWRRPGFEQTALHPAVCVSWDDAVAYTEWLTHKTGRNYRLPTEAEWEYAGRAGAGTTYWWGGAARGGAATCLDCDGTPREEPDAAGTTPVGSHPGNRFGLHDVHGNAGEWLQDCWNESHFGRPDDAHARTDGDCRRRVVRGGHWAAPARAIGFLSREGHFSDLRSNRFGFRVVRDISTGPHD